MKQSDAKNGVNKTGLENTNIDSYGYKKDLRTALPQVLAVCVKNLILLAFGTTLGFATILIPAIEKGGYDETLNLTPEQISWIGSINLICVPVGCLVSGSITNAIGRKRAMQLVNAPLFAAWIIFYTSSSVSMLYTSLVLSGLTGGLLEAPVMVYVAEVVQPYLRGMLSSTATLCVIIGIFLQFFFGIFLTWRQAALINSAIPIISFVCLCFIPESPHWLIQNGRIEDAKKSLQWLRGWTTPEAVEAELRDFILSKDELDSKKTEKNGEKTSIAETVKQYSTKSFAYAYAMVFLGFFLCHFSGITTLQTYAVLIFETLKAPLNKYYATLILGVAQMLGTIICVSLIRFIGKRPLAFFSIAGSGLCFFVIACYAFFIDVNTIGSKNEPDQLKLAALMNTNVSHNYSINFNLSTDENQESLSSISWVPLVFLVSSALISHTGIRLLPWILIGEVYSLETRSFASGLSGGSGYILGFAANKSFFSMVNTLTLPGTFWLYSFISATGLVIYYFFLPETEGYTLSDIEEHFMGIKKLPNSVYRSKESVKTSIMSLETTTISCNSLTQSTIDINEHMQT